MEGGFPLLALKCRSFQPHFSVNVGDDVGQTDMSDGGLRARLHSMRAHWVTRDTILWQAPPFHGAVYTLHYDRSAALTLGPDGPRGGNMIGLRYVDGAVDPVVLAKFPHLRGLATFKLDAADLGQVGDALKSQLAVSLRDHDGRLLDITGIQIPGVLDDLYTYHGDLGIVYDGTVPILHLWAPTAQSVMLHLYDAPQNRSVSSVAMLADPATRVWSIRGASEWTGKYYRYEVEVYAPTTGKIERNFVTDPYSISLSTNSTHSQIVDLRDPALMPPGWNELQKPPLAAFEDIVLYELHVRDFSINDSSVTPLHRGTYRAFAEPEAVGMRHLRGLAEAGLTHLHLLPVFDIASVDEDRDARMEPDPVELASYPPASDRQQAAVMALRDRDGFNWGYDPYHYTVPEGSYATNPAGSARIREFREMVQALSGIGLRVIMDVVYNHTHSGGQSEKSVLDKVVPGYYHRLNAEGGVEKSTCCENTASEHAMMEKLMVDSLRTWATAYKVDGFRFDLMGHHMVANMLKIRDTLGSLTPAQDGVDGSKIYLYGEGWDFGEVAYSARGLNATQANLAGTGIGTFNDRLRDAVRGGGAFSGLQDQGFITGLFTAPNHIGHTSLEHQRHTLLHQMDQIRVGLAGSLRDYQLINLWGNWVRGEELRYNDKPTGYVSDPHEVINYIEAHDNETLWDAIQLKAAPYIGLAQRARMQMVGNSLVCLAQGVPFFHAGQELLRSKSLDRNSYNSGDWFNKLDFSYETNNWGVGLPPGENRHHWPLMAHLLANPALKAGRAEIEGALAHFKMLLRIRKSSKLFRLETAAEIRAKVRFANVGPGQIPGLIVMYLDDTTQPTLDEVYAQIVVLFNAAPHEQTFRDAAFGDRAFELHPAQADSAFMDDGLFLADQAGFRVAPFSTAVFVSRRGRNG